MEKQEPATMEEYVKQLRENAVTLEEYWRHHRFLGTVPEEFNSDPGIPGITIELTLGERKTRYYVEGNTLTLHGGWATAVRLVGRPDAPPVRSTGPAAMESR